MAILFVIGLSTLERYSNRPIRNVWLEFGEKNERINNFKIFKNAYFFVSVQQLFDIDLDLENGRKEAFRTALCICYQDGPHKFDQLLTVFLYI